MADLDVQKIKMCVCAGKWSEDPKRIAHVLKHLKKNGSKGIQVMDSKREVYYSMGVSGSIEYCLLLDKYTFRPKVSMEEVIREMSQEPVAKKTFRPLATFDQIFAEMSSEPEQSNANKPNRENENHHIHHVSEPSGQSNLSQSKFINMDSDNLKRGRGMRARLEQDKHARMQDQNDLIGQRARHYLFDQYNSRDLCGHSIHLRDSWCSRLEAEFGTKEKYQEWFDTMVPKS